MARLPRNLALLASLGSARLVGDRATPCHVTGDVALVGRAFYRAGHQRCDKLTGSEAAGIVRSGGAWAIRNLWGSYILAWVDAGGTLFLLRSPVTGPSLFQIVRPRSGASEGGRYRDHACAFSDPGIARALGFSLRRLDPQTIDAELRFPMLRGHATGITGVREILAGEIVRLGSGAAEPASWRPSDHIFRPPHRTSPEALRSLVGDMVAAWSSCFDRVQLELSGGLDSSIVAACLAPRRRAWRAINLATADPDGDERAYARAVAAHVGVSLAELLLSGAVPDPIAPPSCLRVRAGGFGLLGPADRALLRAARSYGADAIFTGAGGDNIFGFLTSPGPVLDALRFSGPRAGWRAAGDLARITGDDLWKIWRFVFRRMLAKGRLWPVEGRFLSHRYADSRPEHPWFTDLEGAQPGQRAYALKLLLIQPFLDGYDRALAMPMVAPLLSQPLAELGLGVPSWQWGEGGQDRALARRAFRGGLPDVVLARRTKGRITSMFFPAFDAARGRLRHFLFDGWLASEGLLDCDAIDSFIAGRGGNDAVAAIRLLHIADMERWARSVVGEVGHEGGQA